MKYFMSIAAAMVAATLLTASSCEFMDKLWKKADVVTEAPVQAEVSEAPVAEAVVAEEAPMVQEDQIAEEK